MDDKHRGRPGLRIFLVVENMAVISTKCRLLALLATEDRKPLAAATYLDGSTTIFKPIGISYVMVV